MRLTVLGSSSKGNCYILQNDTEALIIELGIPYREVLQALDYNILKVKGCLVTHQHNDHARYIDKFVEKGFYVLALQQVFDAQGVSGSRNIPVQPGRGYLFGNYRIYPFIARHDVPCIGFVISHPDCGKIMFLTDSYTCDFRFKALSHIMIECNYSYRELSEAIVSGRTPSFQRDRLTKSHMELDRCKKILRTTDLSAVNDIILLHLSETNSNGQKFISEVERVTGKSVYVAYQGFSIDFSLI